MKNRFIPGRWSIAIISALVLCGAYGAFLAYHFGSAGANTAPLTTTARFERNWTEWILSGANRETGVPCPAIPSDENGKALPFPDPLFAYAFGGDVPAIGDPARLADSALIDAYAWFSPQFAIETGLPAHAAVSWADIPSGIRESEADLAVSPIRTFLSASVAWSLLTARDRSAPAPSVLMWMRNQATALLMNGYHREGLAFLKALAPFLSETDPEFDAWMGSAVIMQAIDAGTGMEKISLVEKGMTMLEEAVARGEGNLSCLYIRANTYLSLPEFYQDQRDQGLADLAYLVDALENGRRFTYTNAELLQEETPVDPEYLMEVIDWAKNLQGLPSSSRGLLNKLADRVRIATADTGASR